MSDIVAITTGTLTVRKATWEMSDVELARVFAEHFGYTRRGNWISRPDGTSVACGWQDMAKRLQAVGFIRVGQGVNWRKAGKGNLSKATRTSQGYWA